jgi:hypothetical protein
MTPLLQHLAHLHLLRVFWPHFILFWLCFLVPVALCAHWLGAVGEPRSPALRTTMPGRRLAFRLGLSDGISIALFLFFLAFYIFLILYKDDFAYYDNQQLLDFSLQGHFFPAPIWPNVGRFFPLGLQEFNLLMFITKSPVGYHSFAIAQLIVLLVVLFAALEEFKIRYRLLILTAVMLAPSFVISFTGLIYPERDILFCLAIMLACLYGYGKTKSRGYFVTCLVAIQFALYYKETIVVFVVAYAVTRLVLEAYLGWRAGHCDWRKIGKDNYLHFAMLALSGIYTVLFLGALLPNRNFSYIAAHPSGLSSVFLDYLQIDWLLPILIGVLILRFGRLVFSGGEIDPLWDSLGVGCLAYFLCILGLKLYSGYYLAPTNFVAVLYLAYISKRWLSKPTKLRVAVVTAGVLCVLIHDMAYSSFRIIERKGVIIANSQFDQFLQSRMLGMKSGVVDVYFPFADGFRLMELSAYLRHKGIKLAGNDGTDSEAGPVVAFAGRQEFSGNRCVDYAKYACVHEDSAKPGALIVVLPDDEAVPARIDDIRQHSVPALSENACPACSRPGSWFRLLHTVSAGFWQRPLPEHWLQLDVFQ